MLRQVVDLTTRLYYYIFDRFIIYPLLRMLYTKFNCRFLNLGYLPEISDGKVNTLVEQLNENIDMRPHVYLYEKVLSLCPMYPNFAGMNVLEIGCGQGGGIEWIKQYVRVIFDIN
ncbi:hypothetical protein AB6A40_009662 [Gnathostoma spinigerum]|uniref:Uncharacterized protein n=1 Tax=Gnathostoma spinigerum TaxID=75299 RepID=A0ABD6ET05_9BILA